MTIALGVLCGDGLVISADTEETDGFLKTNQSKIFVSQNIHLVTYEKGGREKPSETAATCAVAGAGNAGYIDAVTPLLTGGIWKAKDETEYLKMFGKALREFYRENVIPFAGYPERERPDFSTLIGVTRKGSPDYFLFASEKTALRRCPSFAAVGIGSTFANILLKRLWPQTWVDRKTAALIVAYVMFHVKESVEGCGKFTDIAVLYNGTRGFVPWQIGRDLETLFHRDWRLDRDAVHALFGTSERHQEQSVANVVEQFGEFRKDIAKLTKGLTFDE
jgi:hypothetical protein